MSNDWKLKYDDLKFRYDRQSKALTHSHAYVRKAKEELKEQTVKFKEMQNQIERQMELEEKIEVSNAKQAKLND